jgi:1-acyl-sn-glycerol-3-phosphate acyltransferase
MLAIPMVFRWVLRREVLGIPLFGRALVRAGSIGINRSSRAQAVASLQKVRDVLADGWSVLIFPEGTTTLDGNLLPFKKGAFMLAIQTGAPILPVTCSGTFKILPRGKKIFRPGHVTVTIGKPIPTAGLTKKDIHNLIEQARQEISSHLNPLDTARNAQSQPDPNQH